MARWRQRSMGLVEVVGGLAWIISCASENMDDKEYEKLAVARKAC